MSERFHPRYKRPKSRSEELTRYARAEESLARRLGELPPKPTFLQRARETILKRPPDEEVRRRHMEVVDEITSDSELMIHEGEELLGADDFPYTQPDGPDLPSLSELRADAEAATQYTDQFLEEPAEPHTLFQRARNVFHRNK